MTSLFEGILDFSLGFRLIDNVLHRLSCLSSSYAGTVQSKVAPPFVDVGTGCRGAAPTEGLKSISGSTLSGGGGNMGAGGGAVSTASCTDDIVRILIVKRTYTPGICLRVHHYGRMAKAQTPRIVKAEKTRGRERSLVRGRTRVLHLY